MDITFGTLSHAVGFGIYFLVSAYIAKRYLRRNTDRSLFIATLMTCLWLGVLAYQSHFNSPPFYIRYSIEIVRNAAWFGVLYALLGIKFVPNSNIEKSRRFLSLSSMVTLLIMLVAVLIEGIASVEIVSGKVLLGGQIALSLVGLILLEQIWRNANIYGRSSIKYLSVAIGAIFGYDFLMYSDAFLFQEISTPMWNSRGAVNAMVAPLIALTMINSRKQPIDVQVSRQVIFYTGTLVLAGVYLLLISMGGYYLRTFGGTWGDALQILFFFTAITILVLLLASPKLRARLMVFISQNFFHYKYDYREEWLKSTKTLSFSNAEEELPTSVIRILSKLVESNGGILWYKNDVGDFSVKAYLNCSPIKHDVIDANADILEYFKEHDWIIDLNEYINDPTTYNLLEIPDVILNHPSPWLIIPLFQGNELMGLTLVAQPYTRMELNWENYDLIKVVSRQACSYLSQSQSQERLAESKQFEAVNRTSAFMVHDLKTIIAQLSLLVKNAEKHKANPAFVDDMISTTAHAVQKMEYLLKQIRNPTEEEQLELIELGPIVEDVVLRQSKSLPIPQAQLPDEQIMVKSSKEQLHTVLGHLIQNAQDATDKDGEVTISVKATPGFVVLFIQDTGKGMSERFIKNQLFKPFESTKGLKGMGIGAYQSREYIKKLGGTIDVTSQEGIGSCFSVKIPTS
ncbi:XrtA/PEP-CTERM system histidine kinase PrsK [Alkalimarinus alittae]|uniref:histidine kinase n=1 Tax=Alkalimarinus alittae TaxID=2961619 RepID=A0ABY6MX25_9ALTE|nr:XrtA/PEP-CTERM system histidine kinase PrsK [Alkalimarinus alittae]UZE94374.1 PEP-CTERM system histidine kinase PrsK [Alkalimarinus alittae]